MEEKQTIEPEICCFCETQIEGTPQIVGDQIWCKSCAELSHGVITPWAEKSLHPEDSPQKINNRWEATLLVLRWIAVLPSAVIAMLGIQLIQLLSFYLFFGTWNRGFFPEITADIMGGMAFLWCGALMAPNHRTACGITLICLLSMLTGIAIFVDIVSHEYLNMFRCVVTLVAAGGSLSFGISSSWKTE